MVWPYKSRRGDNDLISGIDISSTVLEVAGIEPPAYMEGHSILGKHVKKETTLLQHATGWMNSGYDAVLKHKTV